MFKIKGYLKKFWYLILACICLLFVQAQTELTLPDYMSDIVSVGIQAGGFASPVSDVLTEETYQHLLLFVDQKDQKTVKKDYKKVSKVNQDIIDTFPKAKGKTVYQLKDLSSDEESELEDILMKPMLIITSLDSMDTSSKEYQEKFGQLPPNMSVYDAISFMDESQKSKMFEDMDTRIDTMGESTLKIAAGNGVKAEYKKLGADIDKVQTDYIFKTGLKMLGIALLGTVAAISVAFFATKVGAGVARALRKDVFEKVESFKDDTKTIDSIYKAGDQGYVYKMIVDGFGGKKSITFMVGFSSDGKIAGYTVLSSGETKGIGSQVGEETFVKSVIGKSNGDEVDAISGATISSTAIKTALNTASSHFASNYQGK